MQRRKRDRDYAWGWGRGRIRAVPARSRQNRQANANRVLQSVTLRAGQITLARPMTEMLSQDLPTGPTTVDGILLREILHAYTVC
jgi:hypothetical protein